MHAATMALPEVATNKPWTPPKRLKITFLGNFGVDFSSESHHAATLESMGHSVIRLQERVATAWDVYDHASNSDLFIWVHTHGWETPGIEDVLVQLKFNGIPSLTYHLDIWLGLERQKDMESDPYWHIEHFFTVDKLMADYLNENTPVKGHHIWAGVFDDEAYMAPLWKDEPMKDVVFVGSRGYHPEWPYRPKLIDWLKETYGDRFWHYGGDGLGVVRGHELNSLYSNTKVVVGDSLCLGFDYPYYSSDRIFETTGRGGFIIYPYIKGLEQKFATNEEMVFYKFDDFTSLHEKIDYYLEHDDEREKIRQAGFQRTKRDHTYNNRWQEILTTIGLA